jgi:hypothetical protein
VKVCTIAGCGKQHDAKGYCKVHYRRWKRLGDPLAALTLAKAGSGWLDRKGYRIFTIGGSNIREHVLIAEKALGRALPKGAVVHHIDENPGNNSNDNLVICPSNAYHSLLHMRLDALKECGNPNWRRCPYCGKHDDPEMMRSEQSGRFVHAICSSNAERKRRWAKNGPPSTVESRALLSCGQSHWRKCWLCKRYDDPPNMREVKRKGGQYFYHLSCKRERYAQKTAERRTQYVIPV